MKWKIGDRVCTQTWRGPKHLNGKKGTVIGLDTSPIPVRVDLDGHGEYGWAEWELKRIDYSLN